MMNLRPARMIDTPAIVDILVKRQPDSRYNGIDEVDVAYAKKLISNGIQRHGGTNHGGCFAMVAEDNEGMVSAFILGTLDRTYHVGHKLIATDVFLLGLADCPVATLNRLFDAYLQWASANPRVIEIGASWSDVIPGSEAFAAFYIRKGFRLAGCSYRLDSAAEPEGIAA